MDFKYWLHAQISKLQYILADFIKVIIKTLNQFDVSSDQTGAKTDFHKAQFRDQTHQKICRWLSKLRVISYELEKFHVKRFQKYAYT
jgi:hypothetical protein